jgi:predicted nucleic acid-binding protein
MILYLDTSALVKKYFKEVGSDDVIAMWKRASAIVTSAVSYAETLAAIYRKKREAQIDDRVLNPIIESFHRDYEAFLIVLVNNDLNKVIRELVSHHTLRAFDAIHLASALTIQQHLPEALVFACFDQKLMATAKSESLQTFPEVAVVDR